MRVLIGTNNKHKLKEIEDIFNLFDFHKFTFLLPNQISNDTFDINENGSSFEENSKIKAREFFNLFHLPVICDDSGLQVDVLGGEPGIFSARYAGDNANDITNRKKLITNLLNLGLSHAPARFVCGMTYYDGNNMIYSEGYCNGNVITTELGEGGFGYDPIFIPDGHNITFAEINQIDKNSISHRANAIQHLIHNLNNII